MTNTTRNPQQDGVDTPFKYKLAIKKIGNGDSGRYMVEVRGANGSYLPNLDPELQARFNGTLTGQTYQTLQTLAEDLVKYFGWSNYKTQNPYASFIQQ